MEHLYLMASIQAATNCRPCDAAGNMLSVLNDFSGIMHSNMQDYLQNTPKMRKSPP